MAPTFFASKLNAFVPMFQHAASKVVPRSHTSPLDDDDSHLGVRIRSSFKSGKMNCSRRTRLGSRSLM
jgi:hypothetical protein